MSNRHRISRPAPPRHQGYTLMELLVAMFIGIFLLVGLFTILQNTRRSSSNQTALAQLQDQQRMAMSLLTDVIQNAGYFDASISSAPVAFPLTGTLATGYPMASSQALSGSDATTGDIIVARYATNGTDGVINCNGATFTTAQTLINMFYIAPVTGGATTYALYCANTGANTTTGIPLVTGVENMQIYYGVSTVAGANNVDTYMTATQVQAAGNWANVTSVRVTLSFVNPLYLQAGYTATTNQYIYLTRVIPIQGRTGVVSAAL
jgi:type IV pilus assembly protein PilW